MDRIVTGTGFALESVNLRVRTSPTASTPKSRAYAKECFSTSVKCVILDSPSHKKQKNSVNQFLNIKSNTNKYFCFKKKSSHLEVEHGPQHSGPSD
jgi:hypothetical protein